MKKEIKLVFIFMFLISPIGVFAQILNIDREGKDDSTFKPINFIGSFTLSSDKQKNNVLDFSTNFELDKNFKNNYALVSVLRNDAVFSGKATIQNEGQMQIRYRDLDTRKISVEGYMQYQWNGAWGMEYRFLSGSNIRMKFFEKRKSDLYIGIGLFKEWEKWNWGGVKKTPLPENTRDTLNQIYRINNYTKYSLKLSDKIDISAISYLQFPLSNQFLKPRWYLESNMYIEAGKHLNFLIHWDHIFDATRVVPIDHFYYSFSTGIQINY